MKRGSILLANQDVACSTCVHMGLLCLIPYELECVFDRHRDDWYIYVPAVGTISCINRPASALSFHLLGRSAAICMHSVAIVVHAPDCITGRVSATNKHSNVPDLFLRYGSHAMDGLLFHRMQKQPVKPLLEFQASHTAQACSSARNSETNW